MPHLTNQPIDEISKSDILNIIRPHEIKEHYEIAHRIHDLLTVTVELLVYAP